MAGKHERQWWKEGVVYQVYPASFKDSNGDGLGDLRGIIEKLDYLRDLGVDILWVSPFFKSPQYDLGYDISDYQDVHAPFGTVKDVDDLIAGCHDRGIRILFDLIINHTSHEHEWFKQSRRSKEDPKRDWYIWRPPKVGPDGERRPPNNWQSMFCESVWQWDDSTQEYYLHLFAPEQPDLNWDNPEVREHLYQNVVRYWLDKGIDGFRIDTVSLFSKAQSFPDAPITDPKSPWQPASKIFRNGPRIHEYLKEMNAKCFSKYNCLTIGELGGDPSHVLSFTAASAKEITTAITFGIATLDHAHSGSTPFTKLDWKVSDFKRITAECQKLSDVENDTLVCQYLECHDQARSVSRFASDAPKHRVASAKMLAMYLLTLSGLPIIYQGEEIGMINAPKDWSIEDEYQDVLSINALKSAQDLAREHNDPQIVEREKEGMRLTARDHARNPMQWDSSPQAGFSTSSKTWMRVMDSYKDINVASQTKDPQSTLSFYKRLITLRKQHKDLLVYGRFKMYDLSNEDTIIFTKRPETTDDPVMLVALNFTDSVKPFSIPDEVKDGVVEWDLLLGTVEEGERKMGQLDAFEGRIYVSRQ